MNKDLISLTMYNLVACLCLYLSNVSAVLVNIDRYKGEIQQLHNRLRADQNAADMRYLRWDTRLERQAGAWSETCRFQHQMRGFGENLAFMSSTGRAPRPIETIRDGIRNWYNEIELWIRRSPRQRREFCGAACHYTQMVWSRTSYLGCSLSYCPVLADERGRTFRNAMYFVCFYYPQGNIIGQLPFTPGPPCSRCHEGREPCFDGLCAGTSTVRRRRSVIESWLCQSSKINCSDVKVHQKCPQACSSKPKDNENSITE